MEQLLKEIKKCTICNDYLELGPNPIVSVSKKSRIIIIGQAPGKKVHESSIPWDDKSGDRLRDWLGVNKNQFYDADLVGLVPMGFCYPGKGKSGDLPPRKECAPQWHSKLLQNMPAIEFTILIGAYAQEYYLPETQKLTLTKRVQSFESYLPKTFVLPHPSPRNNIWMKKNPWFENDLLPILKSKVAHLVNQK